MKLSQTPLAGILASAVLLGGCSTSDIPRPGIPGVPSIPSGGKKPATSCKGRSCVVKFKGTGSTKLPRVLGGKRIQLTKAATKSATVRVAGRSVRLSANQPVRVGVFRLELLPPKGKSTRINVSPAIPF